MRSIVFRIFAIVLLPIGQTLEAKQVAADATWLVHFDVDAIRASIVVQKAWQKVLENSAKAQDFRTSLGRVMIPPNGGLQDGSAVSFISSDEACVFGGVQGGCGPPGDGRGLLDCGGEVSGGGSAESAEVACSIGSLV